MNFEDLRTAGGLVFVALALFVGACAIFLVIAIHKLKNMNIPDDASFSETLLHTPLVVVLIIDLLDLVLDVLAAPLSWIILDRLGLKALRGVAVVEAVIPGTQLIPTLTLCWIGVRILGERRFRTGQSVIGLDRISTSS